MANFLENLRLQSIYGGGRNPFSPVKKNPLGLLDQFINRLPPPDTQMPIQPPPIIEEPEPQRTIIGHSGTSPYQQALIEQRQRELESRERMGQAGLKTKEEIAAEQAEIARGRLDIQQQRTNIAKFRAENPDAKIIAPKGGNVRAINPITGQVIADFGSTGTMTDEERIALEGAQAIEQIGARTAGAKELETHRQTGRETLEETRARHARELKELESGLPLRASTLPSQEKNAAQIRYNRVINKHPEWRGFIQLDPNTGMPIIAEEGTKTGTLGSRVTLTKEMRAEIEKALFDSVPSTAKPTEPKKETDQERLERLKKQAGVTK